MAVQRAGGDLFSLPEAFIIAVAVEVIHIPQIGVLYALHIISTGQQDDSLQQLSRQIGASVGEYSERHNLTSIFCKCRAY